MAVDILNLGFKVDTSQVKTASKDLDNLSESAKKTNESLTGMSASSKKASSDATALSGAVGSLAKAYVAIQGVRMFADIADEQIKYIAQLKVATSSTDEFNQALASSQRIASIAQVSIASVATVYARFANALKDANVSQAQIGLVAENVALALKVSGAGAQEASAAMLQLSQAFGSGVLAGDEFRTMAETAPNLMRVLAESMKVPVGQLKALAGEGKITANELLKAFGDNALNEKLKAQAADITTIAGAWTNFWEQIKLVIAGFGEQGGITDALTGSLNALTAAMQKAKGLFPSAKTYNPEQQKLLDEQNLAYLSKKGALGLREEERLKRVLELEKKLGITYGSRIGGVNAITPQTAPMPNFISTVVPIDVDKLHKQQEETARKNKEAATAAKEVEKANRELLTSIRELVDGERTNIQVLQDKLDHNDKITSKNRQIAQSNLDLARTLDVEAASLEAFNRGLENEADLLNQVADEQKAYEAKMAASYTSISEDLTRENEDLNAKLITNDRERAAEQLRIEHNRKMQMIQSMTEQSDEQDDLIAREMENYRLRNQELQTSQSIVKDLGLTFTSAFEDAVVAGNKLSDVLQSLLQDILKLVTRQLITNPLMGAIGGALQNILPASMGGYTALPDTSANYFTASANGNVMTPNGAMKLNNYANGGVATSPQVSIFGEGRMNEAYVPLPDGRSIPVSMKGGGSNVQVVVNNNTPAQATTSESIDSRGNRRIEVTISELVAGEIKRNGSSANSAIKSTFNTQPTLIGR